MKGLFLGAPAAEGDPSVPETAVLAVCPLPAVSPFEDGWKLGRSEVIFETQLGRPERCAAELTAVHQSTFYTWLCHPSRKES